MDLRLIGMTILVGILYVSMLRLRQRAAQLDPAELSDFLCYTILRGTAAAIIPMLFFCFETMSCFTSIGLENDLCYNTLHTVMFLSIYLCFLVGLTLPRKVLSRKERDIGLTYENITILRLSRRQNIQVVVITTLASMYLFSILGDQGEYNYTVNYIGLGGMVAITAAVVIEVLNLVIGKSANLVREQNVSLNTQEGGLSLSRFTDDMTITGMV